MGKFKVEKIPLEALINLLMHLYDNGIDYVDLSADNSDVNQDKLVIFTKEGYINPEHYNEEGLKNFDIVDEDEDERKPSTIETKKLSDEDINSLL